MLKAFRFDENEHKDLIHFITNYKDNRGKMNESEAIRFLMKKGLESINAPVIQQQNIDIDKLKAEIFQQVVMSVNSIQQPHKFYEEALPMYANPNAVAKFDLKYDKPEPKKYDNVDNEPSSEIKNSNPLISNMLANRKK